ncbi:MAG: sigma-70 family RNA polymerase sigma factor [Eubacteriales bacterium]|nr:sigma-70 family RNA polymerase sigma factor [Eubacteriales bacterium]
MNRNETFRTLYLKYKRVSARVAYRILKDKNLAEDIAQEVFCSIYEMGDRLDIENDKKLHSLIVTLSMNEARDYLKKSYVRHEISTVDEEIAAITLENNSYDLEDMLMNIEARESVRLAFQRLRKINPTNYDILVKVALFGASSGEMAREYGISKNNVNNRVFRSKNWIEEELARMKKE